MPRRTARRPSADRHDVADPGGVRTPKVCSIDEVIARYPSEWIVMRVTGYDEHHRAAKGEVIAHTPSRAKAGRVLTERILSHQPGEGPYYLFDAYRRITTGEEARRSLAALRDQGDPPGRWPGLR